MMILVVLRLQRLLMVEMVRPKHLLLFLGLPFLQVLCRFSASILVEELYAPDLTSSVSGVHLSPVSPELVLDHDHSSPSAGCLSPDAILSSPDNVHADSSIGSQSVPKAQVQQSVHTHLDIPLFPLGSSDEMSNETAALVDDSEDPAGNVSNIELQQKVSDLEMKLKMSEEEKQRIKKDVESLMEKHGISEKDFLKEKEQEAISFQDRYKELQEKHKQELEDMRKMGHEALGIIVDEYKALLQSSVKQQVEAIEKQYISAIEKQAHKCEELLNAQHQRLLEMLDTEKELLKEKITEALVQQSQEQKEILEKCLEEERQKNKEALVSAAKVEQEAMKDVVMKAIEEERKNLEKAHAEERELWKTEHAKDQEKLSQAIETALQEQRKISCCSLQAEAGPRQLSLGIMSPTKGRLRLSSISNLEPANMFP
ncbi:coiled-coil domain-containing protein 91 [Octodon degus]|uniref:Coiled-coil domain-containing protein 91 n=1 Tax=Octodon degus TaxID=10160 RepID=A0A6P6ECK0_OCTDE|nr:coiled-coil domain-containing protein 91 [Octodon degus]